MMIDKEHRDNSFTGDYLWLITISSLEFFRCGKCILSRNNGLASISFLSSTSIIPFFPNISNP